MQSSLLLVAVVSAFFFTHEDPQIMLDKQYRAYITAQAFKPAALKKYRKRVLQVEKPFLNSTRMFINTNIDWDLYAESILKPNWDKLTDKQKQRFKKLLQKVHIKKYGKYFSPSTKFSAIFSKQTEYKLLRGKSFAKVSATLKSTRSDAEIDIDLIFHKGPERWALCDVYVDGVSKSRAYRSQVRKIYKKEGYKGVMKAFRRALKKA